MTKLYKFNKNATISVALMFSNIHIYAQDLVTNQNKVFELEQAPQSSKQLKEVEIIDLKEGQPESIQEVLFKQEEIEKKPFVDPLYLAVSMKDYSKIGAILNSGVNVNQSFIEGNNIVLFSAQYKDITMLQLAVSKKANLNILNNNKESIVYLASTKNGKEYLENIKILLPSKDFEILINKQTKSGRNPLHNAIYNGDLETIKFLVNNKVNLETKDSNGQTPLHYAAALKKWDALEFMLKNGGNIKEIDKD